MGRREVHSDDSDKGRRGGGGVNDGTHNSNAYPKYFSMDAGVVYRNGVLAIVLMAAVSLYYVFEVTVGSFRTLPWNTDYYDLLARGFAAGHLYVPLVPKAELLAANDPFDSAHSSLWLWDASLFRGRYYMYWGPAPALCLLVFKSATGHPGAVLDQWLVLFFMLARAYAGTALILSLSNRRGSRQPTWAIVMAIGVFALASPTPYVLTRPLIYEAAIAAGQCFLFCGLLAAFWGVANRAWRYRLLSLAGTCWAFAMGSRGSLIPVVPMLVVSTAWFATRTQTISRRDSWRPTLAMSVPIIMGYLAYAVYNYQRFGSVTEFGLAHQLTGRPFVNANRFLLPNVTSYLVAPLEWSCHFPFARLSLHRHLTRLIRWPADYDIGTYDGGERVAGVLVATAYVWLVCVWLAGLFVNALGRPPRARIARSIALSGTEQWMLLCSSAMTCAIFPALRMYMANMRFLEDGIGGLLIGATLAGFSIIRRCRSASHTGLRALGPLIYTVLAVHTVAVGICLGFTGPYDNFERQNPGVFHALEAELSVCWD